MQRSTWYSTVAGSPGAIEAALAGDTTYPYFWDYDRRDAPDLAPPIHLRPCCAFGVDLKTQVGAVPVPGYRVENLTQPSLLGPHTYDAGLAGQGTDREVSSDERNAQVYTCRGGFVDTAHVRDYADWTVYLYAWIARKWGAPARLELPPELGPRVVHLHAFDPSTLEPAEAMVLATTLAQWLSFQLSAWHEVAQWHGYHAVPLFPEYPSAYSLEDLYSNVLGTKIAGALLLSGAANTDQDYARNMDVWLRNTLTELGAVPVENGRAYVETVDQHWFDSNARIPDKWITLKRNYDIGGAVHPPQTVPETLQARSTAPDLLTCADDVSLVPLEVVTERDGHVMSDLATLEITIAEEFAAAFPFPTETSRKTRRVTEADFAAIGRANREVDQAELRRRGWLARWGDE